MTRRPCEHCRVNPVRAPHQPQSRYCSQQCKNRAANALKRERATTKRREHMDAWRSVKLTTADLKDFTPAQIEARYQRAREARRKGMRAA